MYHFAALHSPESLRLDGRQILTAQRGHPHCRLWASARSVLTVPSGRSGLRGMLLLAGLMTMTLASHGVGAANADLCRLVSAASVSAAIHASVVRTEAPQSDAGCEYSVRDTGANTSTNHAMSMAGAAGAPPLDPAAQKMLSAFGNAVLDSSSAEAKKSARHPGEVPAFVFSVEDSSDAQQEMKTNRDVQGRIGPVASVPGVGDEAFSSAGSMLMARKGTKIIRFFYTQCSCTTKDVVPIAQKITAAL